MKLYIVWLRIVLIALLIPSETALVVGLGINNKLERTLVLILDLIHEISIGKRITAAYLYLV